MGKNMTTRSQSQDRITSTVHAENLSKEEVEKLINNAVQKAVAVATENMCCEINSLKTEILDLKKQMREMKKKNNQIEQYSRRSNIRICGLEVPAGEPCKKVVANFINENVKGRDGKPVEVSEKDFDAAHPLPPLQVKPKSGQNNPQASKKIPVVIVKFHERATRDTVIKARRSLKGSDYMIQEDLTRANTELLQRLSRASNIKNAWSWEGKVFASVTGLKKPQRFDIDQEV